MSLQDLFASATLHRVREHFVVFFTEEWNALFVPPKIKRNVIGQRKTTNKEKHFYP